MGYPEGDFHGYFFFSKLCCPWKRAEMEKCEMELSANRWRREHSSSAVCVLSATLAPSTHLEKRGKALSTSVVNLLKQQFFLNASTFAATFFRILFVVGPQHFVIHFPFCNCSCRPFIVTSFPLTCPPIFVESLRVGESPCFFSPWLLYSVWMRKTGLKLFVRKKKKPPSFSPQRFYTIHY